MTCYIATSYSNRTNTVRNYIKTGLHWTMAVHRGQDVCYEVETCTDHIESGERLIRFSYRVVDTAK
jgi:hypothetical protein